MTYHTDHLPSIASRLRSAGSEGRKQFTDACRIEGCNWGDSGAALLDDDELYLQDAGQVSKKGPDWGLMCCCGHGSPEWPET